MSASVSPLAPKHYPAMPVIHGVRIATAAAGIKYKGERDLMLMVFDRPAEAAGVFTRSLCPSAPVDFAAAISCMARRARSWSIRAMPRLYRP